MNDGPDTSPDRRRSGRAHAAILNATLALLRETGYAGLRREAVAARAGVGKATIYRWWPTKALLVVEVLEGLVGAPQVALTGDTRADVRVAVDRIATVWAEPTLADALPALAADTADDREARARLAALLGPDRAAVTAVLLAAAAHGDLPHDVDAPLLLDVVFGTLLFRRQQGRAPTPEVVDALTDLLVSGTAPRTTPGATASTALYSTYGE